MSWSLIVALLWVIAATITAMLPYRRQVPPGLALLFTAPPLIAWLTWVHGPAIGLLALAGFASMFRNPLIYFWRKWRGLPVDPPVEGPAESRGVPEE